MLWPLIFLGLVLKIPIVWVGWVVWRAIRDVPEPSDGTEVPIDADDTSGPGRGPRRFRPGPFRRGPHGSPQRTYSRRREAPSRPEVEQA